MNRPQFMNDLSRKRRHKRMRRMNSPRRSWTHRVSLFSRKLTRPLRRRRMAKLNSPRRTWGERLGLLSYTLTRPLRRRRLARLNSPRRTWGERLSVLTHNLTRPLRHVLRVWLRPVRRKWHNRSLTQRQSYGLLALGVVIIVVGAAVILPNVGRVATSSVNAIQNRVQTAQSDGSTQLDSGERLESRCDDLTIRQAVSQVVPDFKRSGMICTPRWLTLQVPTVGGPDAYVIAHSQSTVDGTWELVAVVTKNGESQFGDSELVPPGIMSRAETFASWDVEPAAGD
jgi:hypothetical protein